MLQSCARILANLLTLLAGVIGCASTADAASRNRSHATAAPALRAASAHPPTLTFEATCTPGRRAVIAAVGDLLFHDALQAQALKPGVDFRRFWSPVAPVLHSADIVYGNLESPIAAGVKSGGVATKDPGRSLDRVVYGKAGSALIFNTHPSVAYDLRASGFTVVSTANNHSADRGALGIDRTLDALTAAGIAATGTQRSTTCQPACAGATSPGFPLPSWGRFRAGGNPETVDASLAPAALPAPPPLSWHTRTSVNGITIAWLACTYGLNGMPDRRRQVLQCYRDKDVVMGELKTLAADTSVDAIILTPHWGLEGTHTPLASDKAYAREAIDAGASAIVGSHPHVLQPWEKITTSTGRDALVIYSTGNFISNQPSDAQRSGVIALLEFTKPDTGPARLSAAGFVPTFVEMSNSRDHRVTELKPGRDAFTGTLRLLPAGNHVDARLIRDLPRACAPPATSDLIASRQPSAALPQQAALEPPTQASSLARDDQRTEIAVLADPQTMPTPLMSPQTAHADEPQTHLPQPISPVAPPHAISAKPAIRPPVQTADAMTAAPAPSPSPPPRRKSDPFRHAARFRPLDGA